jgi:hypothetical protein
MYFLQDIIYKQRKSIYIVIIYSLIHKPTIFKYLKGSLNVSDI